MMAKRRHKMNHGLVKMACLKVFIAGEAFILFAITVKDKNQKEQTEWKNLLKRSQLEKIQETKKNNYTNVGPVNYQER